MTGLQTTHPIVRTDSFATVESYVSYLLHRKAYEYAGEMARERSLLDWGCNDGYGLALLKGSPRNLLDWTLLKTLRARHVKGYLNSAP